MDCVEYTIHTHYTHYLNNIEGNLLQLRSVAVNTFGSDPNNVGFESHRSFHLMYEEYIKVPHTPQEWRIHRFDQLLTSIRISRHTPFDLALHIYHNMDLYYSAYMHIVDMHDRFLSSAVTDYNKNVRKYRFRA